MEQMNLKGLSRQELQDFVLSIGEKSFRAGQVWSWMYQKRAVSFDEMTNISKDLRAEFKQLATISSLEEAGRLTSAVSQTVKFLWKLEDGRNIESVYIPEQDRRTVCISTQVGCAMGCVFCATGAMGFIRNLQVHEILDQVICITRIIGIKPTNIVAMGMGEPFLNYENVMKALDIINDPEGIAIGHRKITISTAGIVPGILRYTKENRPYKLAISLNATTDTLRSRLMPVNRKYPVAALIDAARAYTQNSRKRVTFEYVLIRGKNDSPEDAHRLLRMLSGIPCKVNLITYNKTCDAFDRPDERTVQAFAESIRPLCAPVTLRLSRGDDIGGACGQLADASTRQKSARKRFSGKDAAPGKRTGDFRKEKRRRGQSISRDTDTGKQAGDLRKQRRPAKKSPGRDTDTGKQAGDFRKQRRSVKKSPGRDADTGKQTGTHTRQKRQRTRFTGKR